VVRDEGRAHICGKNHKTGYFMVLRRTIGKRMAAKLKEIRQKLRQGLHEKTKDTMEWLKSVVRGYFQYHAVPRNEGRMKTFRYEVRSAAHVVVATSSAEPKNPLDVEQISGDSRKPATASRDSASVSGGALCVETHPR